MAKIQILCRMGKGRARGIFDSWEECKEQVDNFKGAKYKSFDSLEAATEAFRNAPDDYFDVMRKIGEHSRDKLSAPILPPFGYRRQSIGRCGL